ncbi:HUMMR protein, partial [Polyodon spathula]|nr:HUMMR protein [Polyodon spathula]
MYICRGAWRKFAPLARSCTTRFAKNAAAPVRQMSSGAAPGSAGDNLMYIVLCGGSFAGAGYYVYKTLTTDLARYRDRVTEINSRPKSEWTPKPWSSNMVWNGRDQIISLAQAFKIPRDHSQN